MSGFMASGRGTIYRPGRRARLRRGWRDCWCDPAGPRPGSWTVTPVPRALARGARWPRRWSCPPG